MLIVKKIKTTTKRETTIENDGGHQWTTQIKPKEIDLL